MKIIHTSDIHIDSPLTSRLPSDKVRQRRKELLRGFGRLVDEAKRLEAQAIIIAGDLFDSEKVSKRAIDTALDIMESAKDIVFLYLGGNHEGDALNSSGRELPDNLRLFKKEWTYHEIGGITFAGRSEITEGMFNSLSLNKEAKNLVILHGELRDRSASEGAIGIKDAVDKGIDYMALGHYHSYSKTEIDRRGVAVYSGTPEGRGFDETGEKGYVLIDTDREEISHSFVPFARRMLHIIPVDICGAEKSSEILKRCDSELSKIPASDMVRIELVGKYPIGLWKDCEGIVKAFSDRFYYLEIKDTTRPEINPEEYRLDKSLKGEFIRTVYADESLSDNEKEKIIACGINALMGEELFDS